jgi:hypothetical protein
MSYVCRQYLAPASSLQVPCKFPASAMHPRIQFICNAYATPKNLQRICTWYKIHEFLSGCLQRICKSKKSATRMRRRCRELAGNLQGTCRELAGNLQTSSVKFPCIEWELDGMGKEVNSSPERRKKKRPTAHHPPLDRPGPPPGRFVRCRQHLPHGNY